MKSPFPIGRSPWIFGMAPLFLIAVLLEANLQAATKVQRTYKIDRELMRIMDIKDDGPFIEKGARVITYKTVGAKELKMYLFLPEEHERKRNMPAIVFFHGGGFRGGTPAQFWEHSPYFSKRGMACFGIRYRLAGDNATSQDALEDAKDAVRWVRRNSGKYNIDPDRIVASGGSAGGHLAFALACSPEGESKRKGDEAGVSSRPNAVILYNPAVRSIDEEGSVHHVREGLAPTMIFHGEKDEHFPIEFIRGWRDKMVRLGNKCELAEFEGQGHAFFNIWADDGYYYRKTTYMADEFLASIGYLEGRPIMKVEEERSGAGK